MNAKFRQFLLWFLIITGVISLACTTGTTVAEKINVQTAIEKINNKEIKEVTVALDSAELIDKNKTKFIFTFGSDEERETLLQAVGKARSLGSSPIGVRECNTIEKC